MHQAICVWRFVAKPISFSRTGIPYFGLSIIYSPGKQGQPDATKTCAFECLSFTKNKFPSSMLESYAVSTCRAKTSVRLKTKKNRTFCANGDHDWVKKVMQDIDARTALSKYGTTTKNLPAANRHLGGTVLEVDGQVQPTKKVSTASYKTAILSVRTTEGPQPFIERGLAGLETTTSSTWLTPQPETIADKSTLQSGSIANNKLRSETTEGHQRFRELFTPMKKGLEDFARTQLLVSPPVPFPGTDKRSTNSPAFVPETLTSTGPSRNSSLSKLLLEFVRKDKTLITIPTTLSNSSDQRCWSLSSFSTDHKPQSVEESTAQLPTNSSSHSSTHSSSDRNSLNSVRFRGVIDTDREGDTTETSLIIRNSTSDRTFSKSSNTLPIPGYHQETFNESTLIFNPNMPPNCIYPSQSMVQNYIIPVVSVGVVLCVLLAIGGLVYIKRNICTKQSPKRQVQGLWYYPCDSQAESYPMAIV